MVKFYKVNATVTVTERLCGFYVICRRDVSEIVLAESEKQAIDMAVPMIELSNPKVGEYHTIWAEEYSEALKVEEDDPAREPDTHPKPSSAEQTQSQT